MIKKIRSRFIASAMLALFFVLAVIMGGVNILNYQTVVRNADDILSVLVRNEGKFPEKEGNKDNEKKETKPMGEAEGAASWEISKNHDYQDRKLSAEAPYENRFFWVTVDTDGRILASNVKHIAAVDEDTAVQMAMSVLQSGKTVGFSGAYRYAVAQRETGSQVIFLDCTRGMNNFWDFLLASLSISAAGLAAVLVLIFLLSNRIVQPVLEGYEKQKRFITDAGHEIKTPITVIDADAEVLEMEQGSNEWLLDIRAQARKLRELTDKLIFLSRMEEDNQLQMIDFPLTDLVTETVQSFQAPARTQNKQLTVQAEPMLSLCADPAAIRQMVSILVDNAVKHSNPESQIRVSLRNMGRYTVLSVSNPARDMTEAEVENLFERFYRTDRSRNSRTGGFGIGLSVAQAVVSAHKGKISAVLDKGILTVTAALPIK